jgi:hypothetical protein
MVVICLFLCLGHFGCFFLFGFKSLHYVFGLLVFIDHDIAYTKIGDNNSSETKHVISIFGDNRLIIPDSLIVSFEDKENMGNIKLPSLMIGTKLSTGPKELLDYCIILLIPINFGLGHQNGNILLQTIIKLLQRFLYALAVFG